MRQEDTLSGRARAAIAALAPATMQQIRQLVPDVTPQLLFALRRAGHITRVGTRRQYQYSLVREARSYGGTEAEKKARTRARRDRLNEQARNKYAADRGGKVKSRFVPDPRVRVAPKPTSRQQIVLTPAVAPVFSKPPKPKPRRMTSQEWEAQGGKVERLPNGAVSSSVLRHTYTA